MITAYDLAVVIAAHLSGWTAEKHQFHADYPDHPVAYLARPDGAKIFLDLRNGRAEFSGCWPRHADGSQYRPPESDRVRISCSAARNAKALASEITRRLLPTYEPAFSKAKAYVGDSDRSKNEAYAVACRLASFMGGRTPSDKSAHSFTFYAHADSLYSVKVTPSSDGPSVSFEVNGVDEETAKAIFGLLNARKIS